MHNNVSQLFAGCRFPLLGVLLLSGCEFATPEGDAGTDSGPVGVAAGEIGGDCHPDGTCNENHRCLGDVCFGAIPDAGPPADDAGSPVSLDGGAIAIDDAGARDGGPGPEDAGAFGTECSFTRVADCPPGISGEQTLVCTNGFIEIDDSTCDSTVAAFSLPAWPIVESPVLTVLTSGLLDDATTGLQWNPLLSDERMAWADAVAFCDDSTAGGQSDWRLPSMNEVLSVQRYDGVIYIHPAFSEDYPYDTVWTFEDSGVSRMTVRLRIGGANNYAPVGPHHALCVRVETPGLSGPQYEIQGATVRDRKTGLVWAVPFATGKNAQQAIDYCEALVVGGFNDFELPTLKALASIWDPRHQRTNSSEVFPGVSDDIPDSEFWSADRQIRDSQQTAELHTVRFGHLIGHKPVADLASVRCVRAH